MKRFVTALSVLICVPAAAKTFDPPLQMVVSAELADVRAEPQPHAYSYAYDALQETQVSEGEPVIVFERRGDWARIEAPEQPEYTHHDRWEGYPGWVKWKALSKDLSLYQAPRKVELPEKDLRDQVLKNAARHLYHPYLWGGRSMYDANYKRTATGVDCSGLVNLSFRGMGRIVPRDAHEQYMRARPVAPEKLQPGDLFFLAKADNPQKIVHVGFYAGNGEVLEAPNSGEKVRKISFKDRFGVNVEQVKPGQVLQDRVIYFGTFFVEGM